MLGYPTSIYHAAGNTSPSLETARLPEALLPRGLRIDTIAKYSSVLSYHHFALHSPIYMHKRNQFRIVWETLCGFSEYNRNYPYVTQDTAFFAYCQTVTAGGLVKTVRARDKFNSYPTEQEYLADGAAYLMKTVTDTTAITVSEDLKEMAKQGDASSFSNCAAVVCRTRMIAITTKGYYCLVPAFVELGDIICILFGGMTPFVLRPVEDRFILLGECYVHGLMAGEAMESMRRGELEKEWLEIR